MASISMAADRPSRLVVHDEVGPKHVSKAEALRSDVQTTLEMLREHGLRAETTITAELTAHLGCTQIHLESSFVEAKPFPYQVFVRRVDLDPHPITEPLESIVKISPRALSPATYHSLRLGTPMYYRGYEGKGSGIQDREEARN